MNSFRLGDLIKLHNGTKYSHLNAGNIPLYGSGGIMSFIDDYLYDGEAILLPRKGTLNNIMFSNGKIWTIDTMYYATINSNTVPYYLFNYLTQLNLSHLDSGSTLPSMTQSAYYNIEVHLPDFSTQTKIAKVLFDLNTKIELNNKINQELEVMAKTIYDYWFVQFDFPDANGKPYKLSGGIMVYNKHLKREIPLGWEVNNLANWINNDKSGDWGKETNEGNYSVRVSCIRGADINGLNGLGEVKAPTRYMLEKNTHKILEPHDLIIEISGGSPTQSTGRLAYIIEETQDRFENPIICSNFCKAVTLKNVKYLYNFVYQWNRLYDNGVLFGYEGKTSGIKNLLFDSFVNTHQVALPNKVIAEKFYEFMQPIQAKKQKNLLENQQLTTLRDWLLPMLMNGQVTVGEATEYINKAAEPQVKYKNNNYGIN